MPQEKLRERILFRSQVLEWLKDCFRSHLNDSNSTMRNGFFYDIASITKEQENDISLIV